MTNHDSSTTPDSGSDTTEEHDDPRLKEPTGDEGMPGEVLDTPHNLPGDQPENDTPPSRTRATGDA